ncbi:hypothetical protein ACWCY1_37320 [Streptomyces goshikiensis]
MGHTMVIAVPPADLDRLDALVTAQQTAETRWQASAEQQAGLLDLRGPALRAARARIRGERARLRESGTHRVTRWRALAPVLRAELDARGLLREWEPVPEGAQQAGQNLGGAGPYGGAGYTARLCVTLSDALAVPLLRGVYWTNLPHLQALEAWADHWGNRRGQPARGTGRGPRRTRPRRRTDHHHRDDPARRPPPHHQPPAEHTRRVRETGHMTEHRPLGTGPRPTTPPEPPTAARRARLAAEPAEDSATASGARTVTRSPGRFRRCGRRCTTARGRSGRS